MAGVACDLFCSPDETARAGSPITLIGAGFEKEANDVQMPLRRRQGQRRLPLILGSIDFRAGP